MENKLEKSKVELQQTLNRMREFEKDKKYQKAQQCKEKVNQLRILISKLQTKTLKNKQKDDLSTIQLLHSEQLASFCDRWQKQMTDISKQGQEMKSELVMKQKNEIEQAKQLHRIQNQKEQYHQSGAAIALHKKQLALAKLQNYKQAHQIYTQRMKLQQMQRENLKKQRQQILKMQLKKMKTRHQIQMRALEKKICSKIQQSERDRQTEKKQLQKKHQNIISDFKSSQKKQNLLTNGKLKNTDANTKSSSNGLQRVKSAQKINIAFRPLNNDLS